jgi:CPA2 family monovalent cation:H+ antiporter-2
VVTALGTAAAIIALVVVFARRILPPVLERVAMTCSPELFLLSVIAICIGTAYGTSLAGVSVSLGAFLAGLVVSESRFNSQALSEVLPLQIVFSATFFVSIGMLLDLGFLVEHLPDGPRRGARALRGQGRDRGAGRAGRSGSPWRSRPPPP